MTNPCSTNNNLLLHLSKIIVEVLGVRLTMANLHSLYGTACLYSLYVIGLVVYRLWLSPLAKFPGPKLAAATAWYEFYFDAICHGKYTFEIARMHKKYGKSSNIL